MELGLRNRVALVTGASRGLGRAIANGLAAEGCHLALCARDPDRLARTSREIAQRHGVRVEPTALDAGDRDALVRWVEAAHRAFGRLDIVVANAGGLVEQSRPEDFLRSFEIDLMHAVTVCEAALPVMRAQRRGALIAVSSMVAHEDHGPELAAYGALKAALAYFMRSMARGEAAHGIRANIVSPGIIRCAEGYWDRIARDEPAVWDAVLAESPSRRAGTPGEVANVVTFLVSDAASFVSGADLLIDGASTRKR